MAWHSINLTLMKIQAGTAVNVISVYREHSWPDTQQRSSLSNLAASCIDHRWLALAHS